MVTRKSVLSLLFLACGLIPAAHAQFVQQGSKLVGAGAVGIACQGFSVSLSGDGNTAMVGGNCDSNGTGSGSSGAVWVYVRANGVWSQQGPKITIAGAYDLGTSIALSADGNTAIVAGGDDTGNNSAWVLVRANGGWRQQGGQFTRTDAVGKAIRISPVAISGDGNTAIVGGTADNDSTGAAWVYTRANGVWSQQGGKLVGAGTAPNTFQGCSVALSADGLTAIVGGIYEDNGLGAAWVFALTNGAWIQQGSKLSGSNATENALQGSSVALSADGNTALVGGIGTTGGATWVYLRTNGVWAQQGAKLVGSDVFGPADQGASVALSADGNTAVVGGSLDYGGLGAMWVYSRSQGAWSQQGPKLVGAGSVGRPYQGESVALSADGNTAIAGGYGDNGGAGAAWVFVRVNTRLSISTPASASAGSSFNFTVTALDANNSIATGYTGPVHFSSSDPLAVLPADSFLNQGVGSFSATAKTGGTQTITATDTVNPAITGTSPPITVQSNASPSLVVTAPASVTRGAPFLFTLTASQFGTPSSLGKVRFTSSDPSAILPAESLFFGGTYLLAAVLNSSGNQTITATSTSNLYTATSNPIPVVDSPSANLALGKTATQSSTLPGYPFVIARAAVDGNTDGNFFNQSVTSTNLENNPWWQVDLGASSTISSIVIWNRTDCCGPRLNDYWVFVSDTPFGAADTPSTLQNRAGTWSSHQTAAPNPSATIAAGARGRYVRVQLSGANYLSLAEVQVLSNPASAWNVAQGKVATQSSTLPGYAGAGAGSAVDGNTDGNFFNGSVTATNLDPDPWWQVDLGLTTIVYSIVIHNRTDCCWSRLGEYYVFVSDIPFSATDSVSSLQARAGTFWTHQTAAPTPSATVVVGGYSARYVRIIVPGWNYLSLAEVQISGVPNLAQGKAASQSSTLPGYPTAGAAAAVDGQTDGIFSDGSVTATNLDTNAWWQVDLGTSTGIGVIDVWNRTDCCRSRLNDFWIFVSDSPFALSDTPSTLQAKAGVFGAHVTDFGSYPNLYLDTESNNLHGRYVRIQLAGAGYLSLAEVRVFGLPPAHL